MKIRCVVFDDTYLRQLKKRGWIPQDLEIGLEECCLFGGVDGEQQLRAIAIFSYTRLYRRDMRLEYVFVQEGWRRQGIGTELLQMAGAYLQPLGMRRMLCERYGAPEEMETLCAFLKKAGFSPKECEARMVAYSQGDFQGSALDRLRDANPQIWKHVVQIDDYHDRMLRRLLARHEATGFYIKEEDYEPKLCRFYVEDGEIRAAACMRFLPDGSLTTLKGYRSPDLKNKNCMTYLIAALIYGLKTELQPGVKIYVKVYRKKFYESVKALFGEGQEEYPLLEFERVIGGN